MKALPQPKEAQSNRTLAFQVTSYLLAKRWYINIQPHGHGARGAADPHIMEARLVIV